LKIQIYFVSEPIVPLSISIRLFRVSRSSGLISTVFSPVTTAAISSESSAPGGSRIIVYENRTGIVSLFSNFLTTTSRIG
jgi:hypothetical protein